MSRRLTKGFSLFEAVTTAAMSVMVLGAGTSLYLSGLSNWAKGEKLISVGNSSRQSVRKAANELREAMSVSIDSDGMGITFTKPKKDVNGDYILPITSDGYTRRMYYSHGNIYYAYGSNSTRKLVENVIPTDPYMLDGFQLQSKSLSTDGAISFGSTLIGSTVGDDFTAPTITIHGLTAPSYRIFTSTGGSVTRAVIVQCVTMTGAGIRNAVFSRNREEVSLRNIPSGTR